uniref:SET domain-containing protein n=3 Tax=Mesocestoides corti TaxID=53468 RepID=A0A5K3FY52_MESCO
MKQDIPFQLSYHHHMKVYSVDGDGEPSPSHSTPTTSADATPTSSPMMAGRDFTGVGSRKKIKRSLFPDSPLRKSIGRRGAVVPSTLGSAWAKDYKEADVSVYSENLLAFIAQRIAGGRERIQRLPPTCLGRTPLCRVVMFDHNDKGLEASARLGKGEVVTEIRGNLMLLDEYEHFVDPVNEYNRYVMIYHNFGDRAIAINTAQYGNDARFIRRSCIPNCFLDHFVVCNKLRIIIRTKQELMPGVELTIPFDFDYRSCRYALKCACARSRCPVQKWCRKLARHKVMPYLDYSKFIESRLNALSKPISDDQSPATTPNSRSFSADYSPAQSPLSSAQKAAAASLSFATSASSPQRFAVSPSTKHSIPSVRLFSSTGVVAQSSAVQSNVSQTEEATPRKRPAPTPEGPEQKRSASTVTSADRDSPLPFEPIITTRRQAAQAAKTAAMTSAQSKCKR